MKKISAFLIAMTFVTLVSAQSSTFFIEEQTSFTNGTVTPGGFLQANRYFKDSKYGMFTYVFLTQQWGEIVAGVTKTYSLKRDGLIEIGLGTGMETGQTQLRTAAYIFTIINLRKDGKCKLTGLINGEYGGSGYWYVGFLNTNISPKFALGVHAQYGAAWGPRFQFTSKHLMLWCTVGKNVEANSGGGVVGIRLKF
jgi:hypothetical protein